MSRGETMQCLMVDHILQADIARPIRADQPALHLRGWIDKYGEIMRFAGLDEEVRHHFRVCIASGLHTPPLPIVANKAD